MNPPLDDPLAFGAWLLALDDDAFVAYRAELVERSELAPGAPGLLAALDLVRKVERTRTYREFARCLCAFHRPDLDADVFADAAIALTHARVDLGNGPSLDPLRGALEVAERRARNLKPKPDSLTPAQRFDRLRTAAQRVQAYSSTSPGDAPCPG